MFVGERLFPHFQSVRGAVMSSAKPVLHLVCGKIAAGKSTLCEQLASASRSVLISEDFWLTRVYPGEISTLEDYVRCSERLKKAIGPHVVDLLGAGLSVVLDFPANTPGQRRWMRDLIEAAGGIPPAPLSRCGRRRLQIPPAGEKPNRRAWFHRIGRRLRPDSPALHPTVSG